MAIKKLFFNNITKFCLFFVTIVVLTYCDNPADNEQEVNNPKTQIRFTNLEQYPVKIYSDSLRKDLITEIAANSVETIEYYPNSAGTAFYPTFIIQILDSPVITIPYNAPVIITLVKTDVITPVVIERIEALEINSSFLKIINNSEISISLQEEGKEINPISDGTSIIMPKKNAVYEVYPGACSRYSIMRNTINPIDFPDNITNFKKGLVYVVTFNGINLTLTDELSILQTIPPAIPENVQITGGGKSPNVQITWDEVYGATSYRVYRTSGSEFGTYSPIATTKELSFTNTGLASGQTYFYKVSALSNATNEGKQSNAVSVFIVLPPENFRVISKTKNNINIGWNIINGALGYNVYRSESAIGNFEKINANLITGNSFNDTGVQSFTIYFYKINTVFPDIESDLSGYISGDTGILVQGDTLTEKFSWLQNNAVSNTEYVIKLDSDENLAPQNLSYNGKSGISITLIGNYTMRTISLSSAGTLFSIGLDVTLILERNITLKGLNTNNAPLIYIPSQAAMIMNENTKIVDNKGGGVALAENGVYVSPPYYRGGTFTMNGGEISGNSRNNGGGVYLGGQGGAVFTMNGGKITDNSATSSGGGVYISGYSANNYFIMNGGEISGNISEYYGGGVDLEKNSDFTMNNGKIIENMALYRAGGVELYSGIFTMKNGEIANNSAPNGGGIAVSSNGTLRMSGGVIYGENAAAGYGNIATNGVAILKDGGTAQYGVFNGNSFSYYGGLNTTNATVRIVNGSLQTN